jgi:putative peptidoglycan lipid II flippase
MALGILIGGILEVAIHLPFVLRAGYRFWFTGLRRAMKDPGVKRVLALIVPTVVGMAAYQLNDLVSTALAGNAGEGVVSSLQYSLRLQELILGIFAVSIGTVLLPDLAEHAKSGDWDIYNARLIQAMNIIALITVPITLFSLARGENLIRLLFKTRSFNEDSVALTLGAFRFHIPGLYFIALNRILAPAFYAQSDTKSPTLAGIISFASNMALAALLVGPFRGAGIAFALSAASAVNTILLIAFLGKNPRINVGGAIKSALGYSFKMIVFSGMAVTPVFLFGGRLDALFTGKNRIIAQGVPLALWALAFGAIGITLLFISGDKQLFSLLSMLRKKPCRKKSS